MKRLLIFVTTVIFIAGCGKVTIKENRDIYIAHLDDAVKISEMKMSDIFKGVKTIILQTNPQCLVSEINKLQIEDDMIFILDNYKGLGLFQFDGNGIFIRRIGNIGNGPGEYKSPDDFAIDFTNGIIFILDRQKQLVNRYKLEDGKYISSFANGDKTKVQFMHLCSVGGRLYADAYYPNAEAGDKVLLREIDPVNGKQIGKGFLSANKDRRGYVGVNNIIAPTPFANNGNDKAYYIDRYMNELYTLTAREIKPYFMVESNEFINPENIEELNTFPQFPPTAAMDYLTGIDKYEELEKYYETNRYIIFNVTGSGMRKSYNFCYDKEQRSVSSYTRMVADIFYADPIGTYIPYPKYRVPNGWYFSLPAMFVKMYLMENKFTENLDKIDNLRNIDENNNPVIFFFEYK